MSSGIARCAQDPGTGSNWANDLRNSVARVILAARTIEILCRRVCRRRGSSRVDSAGNFSVPTTSDSNGLCLGHRNIAVRLTPRAHFLRPETSPHALRPMVMLRLFGTKWPPAIQCHEPARGSYSAGLGRVNIKPGIAAYSRDGGRYRYAGPGHRDVTGKPDMWRGEPSLSRAKVAAGSLQRTAGTWPVKVAANHALLAAQAPPTCLIRMSRGAPKPHPDRAQPSCNLFCCWQALIMRVFPSSSEEVLFFCDTL